MCLLLLHRQATSPKTASCSQQTLLLAHAIYRKLIFFGEKGTNFKFRKGEDYFVREGNENIFFLGGGCIFLLKKQLEQSKFFLFPNSSSHLQVIGETPYTTAEITAGAPLRNHRFAALYTSATDKAPAAAEPQHTRLATVPSGTAIVESLA